MRSKSLPRHGKFTGAKMLGVMFHPSLGNGTDWGQTFAPRFFDERTKGVTLSRGDAPTIEGVAHSKPRETQLTGEIDLAFRSVGEPCPDREVANVSCVDDGVVHVIRSSSSCAGLNQVQSSCLSLMTTYRDRIEFTSAPSSAATNVLALHSKAAARRSSVTRFGIITPRSISLT
jgi:hypothetical protein